MKINTFIDLKSCETTLHICGCGFAGFYDRKQRYWCAYFVTKRSTLLTEVKF